MNDNIVYFTIDTGQSTTHLLVHGTFEYLDLYIERGLLKRITMDAIRTNHMYNEKERLALIEFPIHMDLLFHQLSLRPDVSGTIDVCYTMIHAKFPYRLRHDNDAPFYYVLNTYFPQFIRYCSGMVGVGYCNVPSIETARSMVVPTSHALTMHVA